MGFCAILKRVLTKTARALFSDPFRFIETITKAEQYMASSIRYYLQMWIKYLNQKKWSHFTPQEQRLVNYSQDPNQAHCCLCKHNSTGT